MLPKQQKYIPPHKRSLGTSKNTERFYAVSIGRRPGIYWSWQWAKRQVEGWAGNTYRKFNDYVGARMYMDQFRAQEEPEQDAENYAYVEDDEGAYYCGDDDDVYAPATTHSSSRNNNNNFVPPNYALEPIVEPWVAGCQPAYFTRDGLRHPIVFADGCSLGNGQQKAKAGYGVFWGKDHANNIAAPQRDGEPTNNRAELMAVIVAAQQAMNEDYKGVQICTDSELVVKTACEWLPLWKANGWRLADGQRVKNQDLVRELDDLLQHIDISFRHVVAHPGSLNQLALGIKMADLLAKEGAKMY